MTWAGFFAFGIGDVVGVLGVLFAAYQASRARTAADKAARAVSRAREQANVYRLLQNVTELILLERDLGRTVAGPSPDRAEVVLHIDGFLRKASQLQGLLAAGATLADVHDIDKKLTTTVDSGRRTRTSLQKSGADAVGGTTTFRNHLSSLLFLLEREQARLEADVNTYDAATAAAVAPQVKQQPGATQ